MAINAWKVCGGVWFAAMSIVLGSCGVAKAPPGWPTGEARPINAVPPSKAAK